MLKRLHAASGVLALLCLLSFWASTVAAELFLGWPSVVVVKGAIVTGLFVMVPAMALAGMTGAVLSRGRRHEVVSAKVKRMKVLVANGVLVMIPVALYLNGKAVAGERDMAFTLAQATELAVGLVQMTLMSLNARDGLRMSGRLRRPAAGCGRTG